MSWLGHALMAIQLKPRFLFGIFLLGILLLVLPVPATDFLGMTVVRHQTRPWIGIATLAAFAFWLIQLWPVVSEWWQRRQSRRAVLNRLDFLSDDERLVLGYCVSRNRQTLLLGVNERWANAAAALCHKGLMERATGAADPCAWAHNVPDFVWCELRRRRDEIVPPEGDAAELLTEKFALLDAVADGKPGDSY